MAQFRVRFEVLHVRYRCGFYVKIFCARVRYRKNSHRFIQIWISFFFCAYGSTFCISSFKLRDFSRTLHQSMHVYDIEGFRMDLFKSGFKFGFFPPTWFCICFMFKGVGFFHVKFIIVFAWVYSNLDPCLDFFFPRMILHQFVQGVGFLHLQYSRYT